MRRQPPPLGTIARSGSVIAWQLGHRAGVIVPGEDPIVEKLELDDVAGVAVSPTGRLLAADCGGTVVVLDRESGWDQIAEHSVRGALHRMAVDDDGLFVAVTANDADEPSTLVVIENDQVTYADIGLATASVLLLDETRRRVLLAGQRGSGSFHGGGQDFVTLFELGEAGEAPSVQWDGPPPIDSPNGWLMPLLFGDVGVYNRHELAIISAELPTPDLDSSERRESEEPFETVVSSPEGRQIAWFWPDDDDPDVTYVRACRLADGSIEELSDIGLLGAFATIAVDDDGNVTLVDSLSPSTIRIHRLGGGRVDVSEHDLG